MLTPTSAWAVTLAAGIVIGWAARTCFCRHRRGAGSWWVAALVGLVGAIVGRLTIDVAFIGWHSRFWGGVFGALILSALWSVILRLAAIDKSQ